jgi:hypothetical protein
MGTGHGSNRLDVKGVIFLFTPKWNVRKLGGTG